MSKRVLDAIGLLETRERELAQQKGAIEDEIRKIGSAKEVLLGIDSRQAPPETSGNERMSLAAAINEALRRVGRGTSREVIDIVQIIRPGAERHSIRSVLSMGKAKGRFSRDEEGRWYIPESAGQ